MATKHTPGPWRVRAVKDSLMRFPNYLVQGPDGLTVADCTNGHDGMPEAANARLIAKAPQMADALRELVGWVDAVLKAPPGLVMDLNVARRLLAEIDGEAR